MSVRILYWFSLTILPLWIGASQSSATTSLMIRNVTIIDGTGRAPVREMSLVISDGRIAAIGAASKIKDPAGVTVIDGMGKFLIPGLWNMHAHLGAYPDASRALAKHPGKLQDGRAYSTNQESGIFPFRRSPSRPPEL